MKKLLLLCSLFFSSFNVHAVPPPPPLPQPLGYLNARVEIEISVTDLSKCNGYFCEQTKQTCAADVKVKVVESSPSELSSFAELIYFNPTTPVCRNTVEGLDHSATIGLFVTLDKAKNLFKLIVDSGAGKRNVSSKDIRLDISNRSVTAFSSLSPNYSWTTYQTPKTFKSYDENLKSKLPATEFTVSAKISFDSLVVESAL